MNKWTWTIIVMVAAAAAAQDTQPAGKAVPVAKPTTAPAAASVVSPEVDKLLDAMEAAGKKFRTLTADVRLTEEEILFGDRTVRSGKVYYRKGTVAGHPAWFRVHFDKFKAGAVGGKEDRDYAFFSNKKGQWFITRHDRTKQYVQYHVAPPGKHINPLKLDQSRFPMPFGQKKAEVLELFDVATAPLRRGDPKDTVQLVLTPKPNASERLKARTVYLWVGKDGLPVQIRIDNADSEVRLTALFSNIDKTVTLADKVFEIPRPAPGSGWEVRIEPLPK